MTDSPESVSRREMLETTAAALAAAQLAGCSPAVPGRFFTAAEFALVDELTEIIIPADDHSPGARAARVASYLDGRLAESLDAEWKERWRSGLATVEALAREIVGTTLLEASPEQRVAVVTRLMETEPFFGELKRWTARGYYTSEIGIHEDQEYQGNVYQRGDYAGFDPA